MRDSFPRRRVHAPDSRPEPREPQERDVLARLRRTATPVTVHGADGDVTGPIVWHDRTRIALWLDGVVRAFWLESVDYSYPDGCGLRSAQERGR